MDELAIEYERPNRLRPITDYSCYRQYLKDFYSYQKARRKGFSFRKFAQLSGVKSPNFLQLVMKDQRRLSESMSENVAIAMGLKGPEKSYFVAMVELEQAVDETKVSLARRNLARFRKKILEKHIPLSEAEILSSWYHTVIREMTFLKEFKSDGEWISKRLRGLVTAEQAERSIQLLVAAGFLEEQNGTLNAKDPILTTGKESRSLLIAKMHTETLKQWAKIILEIEPEDRELGLLQIAISSERIPEFKERIRKFQDEIIGWVVEHQHVQSDQIVELGVYLVPITTKS